MYIYAANCANAWLHVWMHRRSTAHTHNHHGHKTTNANTDSPRQARGGHTDSSEHLAGYTLLLLGGESTGMGGYIQ